MRLVTILPVAPRDIHHVRERLDDYGLALREAMDSHQIFPLLTDARLEIVVDGSISPDQEAALRHNVRSAMGGLGFDTFDASIRITLLARSFGAGIARNVGLAQCFPTDIVTFLDADDPILPWSFSTRLKAFFGASKGARIPFVYSQAIVVFQNPDTKQVLQNVRAVANAANLPIFLQEANVLLTTTVCTLAAALQMAGGFEPYLICGEDGNLWRRVSQQYLQFVPLQFPTCYYMFRKDSQSKALYPFHEKAYHLVKEQFGVMGQKLDPEAKQRALQFETAFAEPERIQALAPGVEIISKETFHGISADHTGSDPLPPAQEEVPAHGG